VGRVVDSGQAIVVPMVNHDPIALSELTNLAEWTEEAWSQLCLPILLSGRPAGALSAYFRRELRADFRSRLGVLEVVAALMSQALRAAYLEANTAPSSEERERSVKALFEYSNMIGESAAMRQVYEQIGQVARTNATALIRGESGCGKELVAHAIHYNSPRARQPFVKVNCAALPEPLIESELFGHERGAFTGAHARKKGRFELAKGGTLFLDEIGQLSPITQAKLLRALQFREFERLGGTETLRTDVRIIAATNTKMEAAIAAGNFREDLYYRLNVFAIMVPALRDRRADIPALAEYFLIKYAAEHGRRVGRISSGALEQLTQYSWPGNVRELENVMERAVVVCSRRVIEVRDLPDFFTRKTSQEPGRRLTLEEAVAQLECKLIEEALRDKDGNCARAARILATTERIVRYKARKYGIDSSHFRGKTK
jgi:Nif-specific regulatory protein